MRIRGRVSDDAAREVARQLDQAAIDVAALQGRFPVGDVLAKSTTGDPISTYSPQDPHARNLNRRPSPRSGG